MPRVYADGDHGVAGTMMGDAARGEGSLWRRAEDRVGSLTARGQRAPAWLRAFFRPLPRFLALLLTTTAAWILLCAWYDFQILGAAFPSAPGYRPDLDVYWTSTWWVLFPVTTILIFRRHAWLPILALAIAGWEDILFYWVQGVAVPPSLPYLPQTPTADALYLRAGLFLVAALCAAIVMRLPSLRIRYVPLEIVTLAAGILGSFWWCLASIPAYVAVERLLHARAHRMEHAGPPAH